jgi:hypothetical protein
MAESILSARRHGRGGQSRFAWRPQRNTRPSHEAIRGLKSPVVEHANGDEEYRDLATDPDELRISVSSIDG